MWNIDVSKRAFLDTTIFRLLGENSKPQKELGPSLFGVLIVRLRREDKLVALQLDDASF